MIDGERDRNRKILLRIKREGEKIERYKDKKDRDEDITEEQKRVRKI
jgi:hypothetical protein